MGVNVKCALPAAVHVRDVANVVGILLGNPKVSETLPHSGTAYCKVDGVSVKTTPIPMLVDIEVDLGDSSSAALSLRKEEGTTYHMSYFFEGEGGTRTLFPKSSAVKIAICKALVSFFGGWVDFNDCDSTERNYRHPVQTAILGESDAAYARLQRKLFALQPLTQKDLDKVQKWAAY